MWVIEIVEVVVGECVGFGTVKKQSGRCSVYLKELHLRLPQNSAASNAGEEGAACKHLKHLVLRQIET
jgi:hypothetical protein